jgi:hypothetical protein
LPYRKPEKLCTAQLVYPHSPQKSKTKPPLTVGVVSVHSTRSQFHFALHLNRKYKSGDGLVPFKGQTRL